MKTWFELNAQSRTASSEDRPFRISPRFLNLAGPGPFLSYDQDRTAWFEQTNRSWSVDPSAKLFFSETKVHQLIPSHFNTVVQSWLQLHLVTLRKINFISKSLDWIKLTLVTRPGKLASKEASMVLDFLNLLMKIKHHVSHGKFEITKNSNRN